MQNIFSSSKRILSTLALGAFLGAEMPAPAQPATAVSPKTGAAALPNNAVSLMPTASDFARYETALNIKAQQAPYGLADNTFMVTRTDMKIIGDAVRERLKSVLAIKLLEPLAKDYPGIQAKGLDKIIKPEMLEANRAALIDAYVLEHQAKFVEHLYKKAGYGSNPAKVLDLIWSMVDKSKIKPLDPKLSGHFMELGFSLNEIGFIAFGLAMDPEVGQGLVEKFDTLDEVTRKNLVVEFRAKLDEMSKNFAEMMKEANEVGLKKLVGDMLESLETRNYMHMTSFSGGLIGMIAPGAPSPWETKSEGAVIAMDDATQSDGAFIQKAFSFDPARINPDFFKIAYLPAFINQHETGHNVMGGREELAEQYAALRYRQIKPETPGTLRMMQDFRSVHFLVSDNPQTVIQYGNTVNSIENALAPEQNIIAGLNAAQLKILARKGYGPDEAPAAFLQIDPTPQKSAIGFGADSMLNMNAVDNAFKKFAAYKDIFVLRVKLFEKYQQIEQDSKLQSPSTMTDYYLRANESMLELATYFSQDGATLMGYGQSEQKKPRELNQTPKPDLDPAILAKAMRSIYADYKPGDVQHRLLADAIRGLGHFENPLQAYQLKPNFTQAPDADDVVVPLSTALFSREIEIDGFKQFRRHLESLENGINPKPHQPMLMDGWGLPKPAGPAGSSAPPTAVPLKLDMPELH